MSTKRNQNFAQKMTALLSAIAASSFLGLPVLAQTSSSPSSATVDCVPGSTQSNRPSMNSSMPNRASSGKTPTSTANNTSDRANPNRSGTRPGVTSSTTDNLNANSDHNSQSSRNTSTSSADDSNTPAVQEYPNQSDPRTGVSLSSNSGATPSTNNDDVTAGTTSNPGSQSSMTNHNNKPQSGNAHSGNAITKSRTDTGVTSGAQTTNQGQTMARCPEGMVPSNRVKPDGSSQSPNQSVPDRNNIPRERTAPSVNQTTDK